MQDHYVARVSYPTNRRAIVGGLRLARRMFAAPALQRFVLEEPAGQPCDSVREHKCATM